MGIRSIYPREKAKFILTTHLIGISAFAYFHALIYHNVISKILNDNHPENLFLANLHKNRFSTSLTITKIISKQLLNVVLFQ